MNAQAANSRSNNDSRCHHRYPNGSRCRLALPGAEVRFCRRHDALPENRSEAGDLAESLTAGITEFRSADDVNEFLSRLLLAFAQDRISPRRAAVLTYITSQLLRSLSASGREIHQAEVQAKQKQPIRLIWDIPSRPPKPEETQS